MTVTGGGQTQGAGHQPRPQKDLAWLVEQISLHWRGLSSTLLALGVVFALVRGTTTTFMTSQAVVEAQEGTFGDPEKAEMLVRAWIDRNPVRREEKVRVRYWFRNRSGGEATNIRALVRAPGFKPTRLKWSTSVTVPPGGERLVWVELVPVEYGGTFSISTIVEWSEGKERRQGTVAIGGVVILSPGLLFLANTTEAFIQVLALPAVLALLGGIFQFTQQRFALERQANQQTLAISQEAWASMLPTSHDNNVKYYLPLLSSAGALLSHAKKLPQHGPEVAFFNLLLMLRRSREVPGFYLMDRKGERLVKELWDYFLNQRLLQGLTEARPGSDGVVKIRAALSSLLDGLDTDESFSSFHTKLGKPLGARRKLKDLQERFRIWATGPYQNDLDLLSLFHRLLHFEVNRVYDFWYGKPQESPRTELQESWNALQQALPQRPDRQALQDILDKLDRYLNELA